MRDGVPERHWESADGRTKMAQIVLPRGKVKEILAELHGGPSGGQPGVNKTLDEIRLRYYWLHLRNDVGKWCQQYDNCAENRGSRTRSRSLMHQYNVGESFQKIANDIAGPFPGSESGNRYLLIDMD
jgi:hypothetical protein